MGFLLGGEVDNLLPDQILTLGKVCQDIVFPAQLYIVVSFSDLKLTSGHESMARAGVASLFAQKLNGND